MKIKYKLLCYVTIILFLFIIIVSVAIKMKENEGECIQWPSSNELSTGDDNFMELHVIADEDLESLFKICKQNSQLIHFLEGYGHSSLSNRAWCTIESACTKNPNALIFLHMISKKLSLTPVAKLVVTTICPNLRVNTIDFESLFNNSPLTEFYEKQLWKTSKWPISHFNDALRWLILHRYGGLYLDLDSISLKALTPPHFKLENFTGLESVDWTGAGVTALSGPKHWLSIHFLNHFAQHFDGYDWGANGPKLLTRVLAERCGLAVPDPATPKCNDFTVLPSKAFYPIPWWEHKKYTNPDETGSIALNILKDEDVKVAHLWHHLTKDYDICVHKNIDVLSAINEAVDGLHATDHQLRFIEETDKARSSTKSGGSFDILVNLQPAEVIAWFACPATLTTVDKL